MWTTVILRRLASNTAHRNSREAHARVRPWRDRDVCRTCLRSWLVLQYSVAYMPATVFAGYRAFDNSDTFPTFTTPHSMDLPFLALRIQCALDSASPALLTTAPPLLKDLVRVSSLLYRYLSMALPPFPINPVTSYSLHLLPYN